MSNQNQHIQVEDSGTESGEDLKLIAAGLRDSIQMHSLKGDQVNNNLICEVTNALNRLETSLIEGRDIKLDQKKRNALLNLVARLQTGLISPDKIITPILGVEQEISSPEDDNRRGSGGRQRFAKRKNRNNRHTVGVSKEELADARRFMEEVVMMENLSHSTTPESNVVTPPEFPITKQQSAGAILKNDTEEPSPLFRPNQFVPVHLKDSSSFLNKSSNCNMDNSSVVQMRDKKPSYKSFKQSNGIEQSEENNQFINQQRRPFSESYSPNLNITQNCEGGLYNNVSGTKKEALKNEEKFKQFNYKSDEEKSVYEKNLYNQTHHFNKPNINNNKNYNNNYNINNDNNENNNNNKNHRGPIWNPMLNEKQYNSHTMESAALENNKLNRFTNKKLLMKRANTIDIPKPMKYINDIESDSEAEERGYNSTKGIGLRGTVQVTLKNRPKRVVPEFEPKTENDHKFLAFIQKQNPTQGLGWNNPHKSKNSTVSNWSNKFGNIKNSFESGAIATSSKPPVPTSSARNFWKKAEDNSTLNLMSQRKTNSSKANEKIIRPPWAERKHYSEEIVSTSKYKEQFENQIMSPIQTTKPISVSKFSHAPMSAFKPIVSSQTMANSQFNPIQTHNNCEEYGYSHEMKTQYSSPTKPFSGFINKNTTSPTLPWASKGCNDNRVQMAAMKIESKSPVHNLVRHQSLKTYPEQLYNHPEFKDCRIVQKRPSLPDTSKYSFNTNYSNPYNNVQYNISSCVPQKQEFQNLPYVCTDYTQPQNISTYIHETSNDSLTNPRAEPLVLTSNRPVISPGDSIGTQKSLNMLNFSNIPQHELKNIKQSYNEISDDELGDFEKMTEYKVETKIMKGPVSQTAVTIGNRTNHTNDDNELEKNSKEAKNLLLFMKNVGNSKSFENNSMNNSLKTKHPICISPDGSSYQAPKVESIFSKTNSSVSNRMPMYENLNQNNTSLNKNQSNQIIHKTDNSVDFQSNISKLKDYNTNKIVAYQQNPVYVDPKTQSNEINKNDLISNNYVGLQNSSNLYINSSFKQPQESVQKSQNKTNKNFNEKENVESDKFQKISHKTVEEFEKKSENQQINTKISKKTQNNEIRQITSVNNKNYEKNEKQKSDIKSGSQNEITRMDEIQVNKQTEVYKSSQPTDTPDIVKSSLPKENLPILKKYGPPQLHSYMPNAFQGIAPKKDSIKVNTKTTSFSNSFARKFVESSAEVKYSAPKIIETPSTPISTPDRSEIPSHIVYNNVTQFSKRSQEVSKTTDNLNNTSGKFPVIQSRSNALSKSDSWHQIIQQQQNAPTKPSSPTRFNLIDNNKIRRVKSGHTLDIPKMFEAGINKSEVSQKQKTVAAYFSGQKSPNSLSRNSSQTNIAIEFEKSKDDQQSLLPTMSAGVITTKIASTTSVKKSSINRIKTSEKTSIQNQNPSSGISRSQTMPHIANINLLDESNVEDAFEQLLKGS